jgi:RHH-type transcriptional regulator, rel operon repressor / antitoxin RelB
MLAIRLPIDVEDRLDAIVKATGRSKTFYVREAILNHLENLEDLDLAEKRLKAVQSGEGELPSLDDVECALGLGD